MMSSVSLKENTTSRKDNTEMTQIWSSLWWPNNEDKDNDHDHDHVPELLEPQVHVVGRGLAHGILHVRAVRLLHSAQVVHAEAHLGRPDKGGAPRVSGSRETSG